ncbi:MAG: ABC transporter ATP-binding protein [Candidatus Moranbacteria bacterium]|nr:ABC transporter ATP-binding protein [Candidatus Moranbacteria bacterium]
MIECKNICKTYVNGDVSTQAVRGISFKIEKGEFVAIIGPSGSGKSTLMHILGALDTPTSGQYSLDGKEISKMSEDELSDLRREKIGFVFQAFNLLPRTTVMRNVMLPLLFSELPMKKREEMAKKSLKYSGLDDEKLYNNFSNQLSGGQIQRVAIARALINDPAIILADEPTGNLDTKTSHIVMNAFQELNRNGHTIVLITHEPEIANFAKRIISVRDGVIEKDTRNI